MFNRFANSYVQHRLSHHADKYVEREQARWLVFHSQRNAFQTHFQDKFST